MESTAKKITHFNGIDTEALSASVAGISADPSLAHVAFRAKTIWQGGVRSRTDVESYELGGQHIARRHQIHSDEPHELLGSNSAPNPQDLILAALAACMTVGFVAAATGLGVELSSLEIETQCALDLRGVLGLDPNVPAGATRIQYVIRVKGSGTREQYEEIQRTVEATSPNFYHLKNPIAIESQLVML